MRRIFHRRASVTGVALTAAMSLTLAACGGDDSGGGDDGGGVEILATTDPLVFEGLKKEIEAMAQEEGIEISSIERVDNINQIILTRIQAGDAPDIAVIPQPGVIGQIVERGEAQPLNDVVDMEALESDMTPGTLEAGTFDDELYGLFISMNVKSLVFYPKKAWEKAGYKPPESLDDLQALTDEIKADGTPPWCFGIGSEASTGWPATDWFEDLIMQTNGSDVYEQWVAHEIPFDSPEVEEAGTTFEELVLTEGNAAGGRESLVSTPFGNADDPMWEPEPGCMLLKQGNFIVSEDFMPKDIVAKQDEEIGLFSTPPAEAGGENPVLIGGDLATLLSDSEDAKKMMELLSDPTLGKDTAASSSFISPHTDFDPSLYPSDLTRQIAEVAYNSDGVLFDGSDQMPGEVGAGTFWKEMTAYIGGDQDLSTSLSNIEESWPAS